MIIKMYYQICYLWWLYRLRKKVRKVETAYLKWMNAVTTPVSDEF